ncbi:unnamed protein product [Fusarium equiseti]|uniref:Uncharacterized protein n=1 Tax=Fusarium equiseti TaxID=61235 RepID=A0A8J2IU80_FUSEQ|nr:unnamed protein product [Fusarium equiseti]
MLASTILESAAQDKAEEKLQEISRLGELLPRSEYFKPQKDGRKASKVLGKTPSKVAKQRSKPVVAPSISKTVQENFPPSLKAWNFIKVDDELQLLEIWKVVRYNEIANGLEREEEDADLASMGKMKFTPAEKAAKRLANGGRWEPNTAALRQDTQPDVSSHSEPAFGNQPQRLCSVKAQLSRRGAQITKLIAILRRKIATNRVMQTALKAAYKILPSLEEQVTYARILDMAKKAPNKVGINQEVSNALKEAGLVVQWDKQSLQSPIQILKNKSVQTVNSKPDVKTNQESQKRPKLVPLPTIIIEQDEGNVKFSLFLATFPKPGAISQRLTWLRPTSASVSVVLWH